MIRLAKTEDLNNITDVYSYARKFMAENGTTALPMRKNSARAAHLSQRQPHS